PVFGDGHFLPDDLAHDVGKRLDARRTSSGIAALPGLKPAMLRGPAIADAVLRVRPGGLDIRRKVGLRRQGVPGLLLIVVHWLLHDSNRPHSNTKLPRGSKRLIPR